VVGHAILLRPSVIRSSL